MAYIVEQFVGDRGIQLGYEEFVRPLSFGTNWQKLRLGVHWAFNGSATLPIGIQPRLGFCVGNTGWFGSPVDAISGVPWGGGTPQLTGTPPATYYQSSATTVLTQQNIAGSVTNVANSYNYSGASASLYPTTVRSAQFFTLTKGTSGSSAITHQYGGTLTAQAAVDVSRSSFLAQMENEAAAVSGLTLGTNSATTLASGVYTKLWDSIFINWSRAVPTVCIYEICVVRYL